MLEQATLNQAAQVLAGLRPGERADSALRAYFAARRYLRPGARRALSRAVFSYFRWLRWLEDRAAPQARIAQAAALQERFDATPGAIKPQALVARAVPDWVREEMEVSPEHARQLQREPALWLRARLPPSHRTRSATRVARIFSAPRHSTRERSKSRISPPNWWASPARRAPVRRGGTPAPVRAARRCTSVI
jgi:hypothetical protein